ncbi:MAG: hypothetical protein H6674_10525 [Dehalococcoidia bacterium]|nr:hypothetical protein [Dehalococcoidia bacterium]MCB9508186.1 hypothetical protein [Myxococcales bacterium]
MTEPCPAVVPHLADAAVGRADPVVRRVVDEHVARCPTCADELAELTAAWRDLDRWEAPAPPARAEIELFARVRAELAAPHEPRSVAASLALGLVAASVAAAAIHLRAPVAAGSFSLLVCGGIWTVGFALAFHVVLARRPQRGARAALWASAVLVVLSLACPVGPLADACQGSTVLARLLGRGDGAFFAVGLLYGLVPTVLGLAVTRPHGQRGLVAALPVVLAIAAFELPVFYLQCRPFAAGAFATTLAGALLGAGVASLTDLRWLARPARTIS